MNILINELIEFINTKIANISDDILLIITADHGEGFGVDKYARFHEVYKPNKRIYTLYYDQLHIPLVLITNSDRIESMVRNISDNKILITTIDIFPTILDICCKNMLQRVANFIHGVSIFNYKAYGREYIIAETPAYREGFKWYGKSVAILKDDGYKLTLHPLIGVKFTNIKKDPYEVKTCNNNLILKDFTHIIEQNLMIEKITKIKLKLLHRSSFK